MRVMLVDDHRTVIDNLSKMIQMGSHHLDVDDAWHVKAHTDPDEALKDAKQERPDILITDYKMPPKMTGMQLAKRFRDEVDPEHKTLVILISAYTDLLPGENLAKFGVDITMAKPVPIGELLDTLKNKNVELKQASR
jgi:CheY-like chemotaxis protein